MPSKLPATKVTVKPAAMTRSPEKSWPRDRPRAIVGSVVNCTEPPLIATPMRCKRCESVRRGSGYVNRRQRERQPRKGGSDRVGEGSYYTWAARRGGKRPRTSGQAVPHGSPARRMAYPSLCGRPPPALQERSLAGHALCAFDPVAVGQWGREAYRARRLTYF